MFYFICKNILHCRSTFTASLSAIHKLHFLQNYPSGLFSVRFKSNNANEQSLVVSYLINSCGLSLESALSASKRVNFKTLEKPDSVLSFLSDRGFSKSQISVLIKRIPSLLTCDPKATLLPKFEFFHSKGFKITDLIHIFCQQPSVLRRSLEKQIVPSFNFLKNLLKSEECTITVIRRSTRILLFDLETFVLSNVNILRENGVLETQILSLLKYQPRSFMVKPDVYREIVEEVKKLGINPLRTKFCIAVLAFRAMSKTTRERKMKVYKRWGWSEEDTFEAFRKYPWCMMVSEDKIMSVMDCLVAKMGLESLLIAKRPILLTLSLEKRIIPRVAVFQELLSKGLIKKDLDFRRWFEVPEKLFLKRFVEPYQEQAPQLLKLYDEKLKPSL